MGAEQTGGAELPEEFLRKMKALLGEEFELFLDSLNGERMQGLRLNPLKVKQEEIGGLTERFGLRKIAWAEEGYYYERESMPGKHPWHDAGVFYIQEPSAMAVAELLDVRPGERVLDLCGAPGGKTTQIGGKLLGKGLLVSNEIHPARAKILSQNVERMGIGNGVVLNEEPEVLAERFPGFFDKIVVDAPCSGEGMFRKDEEARRQWSPENVVRCAKRQAVILDCAAAMLRPGGRMVYSTCTFSPEENEESIDGFLRRNPEFLIEHVNACHKLDKGRPEWTKSRREELSNTFRIWPHRAEGEGHYAAVLKKKEEALIHRIKRSGKPSYVKEKQVKTVWQEFCRSTMTEEGMKQFEGKWEECLLLFGDQLYHIPEEMTDLTGLHVLRAGLHLGTLKKNRFEPSHALALCLKPGQVKRKQVWGEESPEMAAYLRGETLKASEADGNGWTLILAGAYSVGWAKQAGGTLKNHYPKGLRRKK